MSRDPAEWAAVESLLEQCRPRTVPVPQTGSGPAPSGFTMPSARPGQYPYFVRRPASWMLPVYVSQSEGALQPGHVITTVRRVEGDVEALRQQLLQFLFSRYKQDFVSQANELMQKVVFRGNFDADFKEFLRDKGF